MAKLKVPLFSLGASQKLGNALVFFPWKGLNVVREYVIPANPKTTAQNTQRGYLRAAVAALHVVQGLTTKPWTIKDAMAYALWASAVQPATTWFNQVCRNWIDQKVLGHQGNIYHGGDVDPSNEKLTLYLGFAEEGAVIVTGNIHYGTSKTALVNTVAATRTELTAGKDVPNLTNGVKYFLQYRPLTPTYYAKAWSGIYYGVPKA